LAGERSKRNKKHLHEKNKCSFSYHPGPKPRTGVGTVGDACLDEFLVALLKGIKQLSRRFRLFENSPPINSESR
jgi:hypothetical protein